MGKNSTDVYGAAGKTNVLLLEPEKLKLITDEDHPLYDERVHLPVDDSLVKNIMVNGVIEPIVIRKNTENGDIEVVVGRQRTKATIEANKRLDKAGLEKILIPATVRRGEDAALAGVMVSENEIRKGDSPIIRAKKMNRLIAMGKSEEEIGVFFGVSKATVKNTVGVLDCCAAVRKAVDDGEINVTAAYGLAKLDAEEQKATLEKMLAAGAGTKGKHAKTRAQKTAAGKTVAASKNEIIKYRADVMKNCNDHDFKVNALQILDFVLGKRGAPKFPKAEET